DITAVLEAKNTSGTSWRYYVNSPDDSDAFTPGGSGLVMGNGTLTFDNDGKLQGVTGNTITIDRAGTGAGTPISMTMNFDGMTGLANATGKSTMFMSVQDGAPMGTLNAFSVGANGIITGSFDNGLTQTLGQVAIASFTNPQGLEDKGGNMFVAGANSGVAIITSPLNLGTGGVRSGALELSNVDLSTEFINLIISSTGFSASSRVITTSDQLITELLNASR
ncbi:MAG TPA: flagellar hook-basal body complex protein, partial [Tepidisphaeraceae bacterium]|nr:flagellar hook-basal body complex protein [Tepidisphaeraceae bacterium]